MPIEMTAVDLVAHYRRLGIPVPAQTAKELGITADDPAPKKRKYKNEPTVYNGRRYDSKKEAARAGELDLLVKAGEIVTWIPQVKFLLPGDISYVADFVILHRDGSYTVEDVKSPATRKNRTYINKRKQMAACHGVTVVEV